MRFVPYATTAVVIGAAPDTPDTAVTAGDLLSFYRGTKLQWTSGREMGHTGMDIVQWPVCEPAA